MILLGLLGACITVVSAHYFGLLIANGLRHRHIVSKVDAVNTTSIHSVSDINSQAKDFLGKIISLTGTANTDKPLLAERSEQQVVFYHTSVTQEYTLKATSENESESGTLHTDEIVSEKHFTPFYLEEGTHQKIFVDFVTLNPDAVEVVEWYDTKPPVGFVTDEKHEEERQTVRYKYVESSIPCETPLYVFGQVFSLNDQLVIANPIQYKTLGILMAPSQEQLHTALQKQTQFSFAVNLTKILVSAAMVALGLFIVLNVNV
ncbi:MAG TPA: hypothetical protein DCS93_18660 [Microscillaceae bacterium]|nr:hypothetical protein [Microscillaceae bacterium]